VHARPGRQWPGNSGASIDDRRMRLVPQRIVSPSNILGLTQPTSEAGPCSVRDQRGILPSRWMIISPKAAPAIIAETIKGRSVSSLAPLLRRRERRENTVLPCRRLDLVLSSRRKSKSSFMQDLLMKSCGLSSKVAVLAGRPISQTVPAHKIPATCAHRRSRCKPRTEADLSPRYAALRSKSVVSIGSLARESGRTRFPIACGAFQTGGSAGGIHHMIAPNVHAAECSRIGFHKYSGAPEARWRYIDEEFTRGEARLAFEAA